MRNSEKYNLKILYVEDESETREALARFFKRRFTKVFVADNGSDAVEKFTELNPDIIVTDLLMPEMSGVDLLKHAKEAGYQNPVVVLSALQDINLAVKTFNLGIDQYIMKPVNLEELNLVMERLANKLMEGDQATLVMTSDERRLKEDSISYEVSALLKAKSGKGPRVVKVFIGNSKVEINCIGFSTVYEETLMQQRKNAPVIEQLRQFFFQMIKADMEALVSKQLSLSVSVDGIDVDFSRGTVKISLAL